MTMASTQLMLANCGVICRRCHCHNNENRAHELYVVEGQSLDNFVLSHFKQRMGLNSTFEVLFFLQT